MKITDIKQDIEWKVESVEVYRNRLCVMPTVYTYNNINCKVNGLDYTCKDLLKYQEPKLIVQKVNSRDIELKFKEESKQVIDSEALKDTYQYKKAKTKEEILGNFEGLEKEILLTYFQVNKPKDKLFREAVDASDVSKFYLEENKYFSSIVNVELDLEFKVKDPINAIKQSLAYDLYDYLNIIYLNDLKLSGESVSEVFELAEVLNDIDSEVCSQRLQELYEHYVNFGKIFSTLTKEEQLNLFKSEFDEDELEIFEEYFEGI